MAHLFANARDRYPEGGVNHNLQRQPYGVGLGASYSNYKKELTHMMKLITADSTSDSRNDGSTLGEDGEAIMAEAESTCN